MRCAPAVLSLYNANNMDSGDGWLSLGYLPVFPPTDTPNDETAFVRDRYDCLALALLRFKVYKASHHDQVNCSLMYTRFGLDSQDHSGSVPSQTLGIRIMHPSWTSISLPSIHLFLSILLMSMKSKPNMEERVTIRVPPTFRILLRWRMPGKRSV
jgi:hypothetical protein